MTRYEIEEHLDNLYRDLEVAKNMDEETAQRVYSVDRKAERVEVIQDEIDTYEVLLEEYKEPIRNYERTADIPYLCW